jgi:hypothetical protein
MRKGVKGKYNIPKNYPNIILGDRNIHNIILADKNVYEPFTNSLSTDSTYHVTRAFALAIFAIAFLNYKSIYKRIKHFYKFLRTL